KSPFPSGTVSQKLIWHQVRQPKPVRALRPEVPEELARIIERMMAKEPAERYQTPAEVAEALIPWTQSAIPPPPEKEMPPWGNAPLGGLSGTGSNNTPVSRGVGPATPISRTPKGMIPRSGPALQVVPPAQGTTVKRESPSSGDVSA